MFYIILFSVLALLLIIIIIVFLCSHKKKSKTKKSDYGKDVYKFDKRPLSKYDEESIDSAGQKAENAVSNVLNQLSNSYECFLYENLCLEDKGKYSIEIDHLLLTHGGLFVIETKGNIGVITGDISEKVWFAKKPNGKTKKLKNPVIQTLSHAKFIRILMDDFYPKMYPIAIFPFADISNITNDAVLDISRAVKKIKVACKSTKYDDDLFNNFNNKILRMIEKHSISKEKHLQNIKERFDV